MIIKGSAREEAEVRCSSSEEVSGPLGNKSHLRRYFRATFGGLQGPGRGWGGRCEIGHLPYSQVWEGSLGRERLPNFPSTWSWWHLTHLLFIIGRPGLASPLTISSVSICLSPLKILDNKNLHVISLPKHFLYYLMIICPPELSPCFFCYLL